MGPHLTYDELRQTGLLVTCCDSIGYVQLVIDHDAVAGVRPVLIDDEDFGFTALQLTSGEVLVVVGSSDNHRERLTLFDPKDGVT